MTRQLKVGLFVLFGLVFAGISVFLIGENRSMWSSKVEYRAAFADVAGLKPGAPVRMGGVNVGLVTEVAHATDERDPKIYVKISVVRTESVRVREDTIARVVNKGLLGDKMIELTSDGKGPKLDAEKQLLKTEEPIDFQKYITKFEGIANKAESAVDNIERATRPLSDPQFSEDLQTSVHSLRVILEGVAKNDSAAHRVLIDPRSGQQISAILGNLAGATADLHDASQHLRAGPGIAHALLYDGKMSENASGSLAELHADLKAVRQGNGLAHALIYGDSSSQKIMGNVNAISSDFRAIVSNVRKGKGTVGALLVDPTIYEDIKRLVGNLERNQVLRSLVRYSIEADEAKKTPSVKPAATK